MVAYFEYLREMFLKVMGDIDTFLFKAFISPWTDLGNNFATYNSYLTAHSKDFGFVGWLFWVIMLLLLIGLAAGVIFLIVIFFRKYIRFVKKELDKEELARQVERLNYELFQAIQEKDKILNLQVGYMGLKVLNLLKWIKRAKKLLKKYPPASQNLSMLITNIEAQIWTFLIVQTSPLKNYVMPSVTSLLVT